MAKIIKSDELTINNIPNSNASWDEISTFALSFDPMLELGTTDIYKIPFIKFNERSSVQELRISLFLLQRWWNNQLRNIDEDGLEKLRKILILLTKKLSE